MKKLIYIFNILLTMFVFASCKDENVFVSIEDEPFYSILVSIPDNSTRATYKEDGENIAVVWEKGDVLKIGSNEFVFKEMQGTNGLFFHYGELTGDKTQATFGFSANGEGSQVQSKNNHCREVLEGSVPADYDFTPNTKDKGVIQLFPAQNMSLLHIQTKSPAMFLGGSLLEIKGLDKNYSVSLGEDPSLVFADKGDTLDVFVVVPSGKTVSGTLRFYFYAYDENKKNAEDGDEYHYYMKCNASVSTKYNEVVKMPLPSKPTHTALQLGLPSGTKWATTNLGATKESEAGEYYAWGEIEPAAGGDYSPANCKAYNMNWSELYNSGIITKADKTGILTPENDAATQNWGDDWKIPTKKEYEELINPTYCSYEMVKYGERYGFEFTSKKNGKKIFFPNGGQWEGLKDCTTIEAWQNYGGNKKVTNYCRGQYWVSNVVENKARDRGCAFTSVKSSNGKFTDEPNFQDQNRTYGRNVRAVIKR